MTIKDMELQTGLARANIRYYEAEGLISHTIRFWWQRAALR